MSAEVATVLRRAQARIADPARRTTGAYAKDAEGARVDPAGPRACGWCVAGAVQAESSDIYGVRWRALIALTSAIGMRVGGSHDTPVVMFGDDPKTTHAMVMAAFDKAIAAEEARS